MALRSYRVRFHGVSAHASIKPEAGRSALDALLLAFNAVEFLREHVREDVKMHYAIRQTGASTNVVPDFVEASFTLRSFSSEYLEEVCGRFVNIIQGAALMTGTQVDTCLTA
jgi:metal-dependent amidase/aminoacylase/carboxypeptidase family protein